MEIARRHFEYSLPGQVALSYYDVFAIHVQADKGEQIRHFEEQHLSYPVSVVEGEIVSVGSVSVFALARAVQRVQQRGSYGKEHP